MHVLVSSKKFGSPPANNVSTISVNTLNVARFHRVSPHFFLVLLVLIQRCRKGCPRMSHDVTQMRPSMSQDGMG